MKFLLPLLACLVCFEVLADPLPSNRRIDWSTAGNNQPATNGYTLFCHSGVSIPGTNITVHADGSTDDYIALQTCYNLASNKSIIYVPDGVMKVSTEVDCKMTAGFPNQQKQVIWRSESGNTWWSNTATSGDALNIFQGTIGSPFNLSNNIIAGATNGSSEIFLGNASTVMTVGTYEVAAYQMPLSTTGIPATSGTGGLPYPIVGNGCNDDANFLHGGTQIITVTNVISNTDIKFTPPLRWNLMTNQPYVIKTSYCQGVGVENINFTFSQAGSAIRNLIEISLVQNCWVTGCTLSNTLNNAIRLGQTSHTLIQSNIIEYAWDYVGGYGYGVWEFECESDDLIVNNIFQNLRHAYAAEGWVSGTVVAYNYETNELFRSASGTPINAVSGSYITHAIGSEYILFEGNFGDFIEYDNIQGDGQLNTSFRNRLTPITHNSDWPGGLTNQNGTICFTIYTNNQYESVIGNVLGLAGVSSHYQSTPTNNTFFGALIYAVGFSCDNNGDSGTAAPNCLSNLLRSVNYDYVNNAIVSDVDIDTNLPNSYYLTNKPSWWNSRPWPSIGPDLAVMTSPNPAMDRFYNLQPASVTNLTINASTNIMVIGSGGNLTVNGAVQTNGVTAGDGTGTTTLIGSPFAMSVGTYSYNPPISAFGTTPGPFNFTVTYIGNYGSLTSATLIINLVQYGTALTVGSSANPSIAGNSITITASGFTNSMPIIPATGLVHFTDLTTSTSLGSASMSSGQAQISTSALTAGTHVIRASYDGDTNYTPATNTFSQAVIPPPTVFYPPYLAGTPVVIQPTPDAAWYQFGGNGGIGNDSSGNGNTAIYPNGGTFGTVSIGTKSVHVITLDGSTQFGQVADNSTLHFASSFSVSCWFKTTVNATEMFVSKYDSGFTVGFDAHQGHGSPLTSCIGSELDSVGPGHVDNIAGGTGLNDGNWHHQVIVKDVTGNTFHLYVDGIHRTSAVITVGSLAGATGNMELGALFDVSNIDFLNGSLADVELYSTALSQAQVTALYNNGNGAR